MTNSVDFFSPSELREIADGRRSFAPLSTTPDVVLAVQSEGFTHFARLRDRLVLYRRMVCVECGVAVLSGTPSLLARHARIDRLIELGLVLDPEPPTAAECGCFG